MPIHVREVPTKKINITAQQLSGNRNGCTIRSTSEITSSKVEEIKNIMGVECTVQDHKLFNISKDLIYIRDITMENVASFRQGMKIKYHASEVAEER